MANYLLSLQFDTSGCTNKNVINLGGVSFNNKTSLGRAAYFNPYNINSGLMINNTNLKTELETSNKWCIYFKYRVNKNDINYDSIPILVYQKDNEFINFLSIDNKSTFAINIADRIYTSKDISYSFDDEWHTFYLYFRKNTIQFFIDGYEDLLYNGTSNIEFGDNVFIGINMSTKTNFCGYLNDFNIFKGIIYNRSFVPPSDYIYTSDVISNYKNRSYINKEDFEKELVDSIEHNREHTASRVVEYQKIYTPRRLKITWYQIDDGYFETYNFRFNTELDNITYTYINITGIDTNLLKKDDKYFSNNLETALEMNKVYPLMVFVNKKLVRLSRIKLIKSDEWYTLVIKDLPKHFIVNTLDIILLPFPVIYEEDYGERADLEPLYSFDKEGHFAVSGLAHTYYYIDKEKDDHVKHIGIREYYCNTQNAKDVKQEDYLNFIWRYGHLEPSRITEDNGVFMQFRAGDYGYIRPGDDIVLYSGTTLINPSLYKIIGYDLIYFYDMDDVTIFEGRTITMQVITDIKEPKKKMLLKDFTEVAMTDVTATKNDQSVFKIPDLVDGKGFPYRQFLVFKGHVLMEDKDRYTIDYDKKELRLTNRKDFLAAGRSLTFIFVGIENMDARGRLYTKPIFYYALPNEDDLSKATIQTDNITINKNNCIVFVNGTLISAYRYKIENNTICMKDYTFSENANIILVMLKTIDELEDPYIWRSKVIYNELSKGKRYILYDLHIPKEIKITLNNLLCFDEDGCLITDLIGSIYNYNIIKQLKTSEPLERTPKFLTCVYRDDGLDHKTNLNRLGNESYMKDYILGKEEFYEMDEHFDELMADFEFVHRRDTTYGENLSKSLNYIVSYNQNRIDDVYEKRATAFIKDYNISSFNKSLVKDGDKYELSIPRDEYDTNKKRTFPLFFQDGLLVDWDIKESANNTIVRLDNRLPSFSKLKSINFKGLSNFLYQLYSLDDDTKALTLKANKTSNEYIHSRIRIGEEIETHFYADLVVVEYTNKDIYCSLDVNDIFLPEPVHWPFKQDLLDATLAVREDYYYDFIFIIKVLTDRSSQIDIEKLKTEGNYIDIFARIKIE